MQVAANPKRVSGIDVLHYCCVSLIANPRMDGPTSAECTAPLPLSDLLHHLWHHLDHDGRASMRLTCKSVQDSADLLTTKLSIKEAEGLSWFQFDESCSAIEKCLSLQHLNIATRDQCELGAVFPPGLVPPLSLLTLTWSSESESDGQARSVAIQSRAGITT